MMFCTSWEQREEMDLLVLSLKGRREMYCKHDVTVETGHLHRKKPFQLQKPFSHLKRPMNVHT